MNGWDVAERMGKGKGRRGLDRCSTGLHREARRG